jgi:hypothetical protein
LEVLGQRGWESGYIANVLYCEGSRPGLKNIVCQVRLFSQPQPGMYLYSLSRDVNICSDVQTISDVIISPIVYIVASIDLELSNSTANYSGPQ